MGELLQFVVVRHWRLALGAAALFASGLLASVPVGLCRIRAVEWLPLKALRLVLKLMGPRPALWRMAALIWAFNSAAIFLYMASGFHPAPPMIFAAWTGLNVGLVLAASRRRDEGSAWELGRPLGGWVPPAWLALACGALVVVLELPCFWYAIAMGISMGRGVMNGLGYLDLLAPRALAYAAFIVPSLLVSAAAEAVAVRAGLTAEDASPGHPGGAPAA